MAILLLNSSELSLRSPALVGNFGLLAQKKVGLGGGGIEMLYVGNHSITMGDLWAAAQQSLGN